MWVFALCSVAGMQTEVSYWYQHWPFCPPPLSVALAAGVGLGCALVVLLWLSRTAVRLPSLILILGAAATVAVAGLVVWVAVEGSVATTYLAFGAALAPLLLSRAGHGKRERS